VDSAEFEVKILSNEFITPLRVYIEDTDAGGIVYYVNYLKFMERARTELFRKLGFPKPAMIADGLLLVVASAQVNYQKSALLDDQLEVSASVSTLRRSYIVFQQKVMREGEVLCQAEIKIACVSRHNMQVSRLPEKVHIAFKEYLT